MYDVNKIKTEFIKSSSDNLKIEIAYTIPKGEIKGIVQRKYGKWYKHNIWRSIRKCKT